MTAIDIVRHEQWFTAYADRKIAAAEAQAELATEGVAEVLRLKCGHTHRVLTGAREIVRAESFPPRLGRATLLAALYHDVGRFDQYLRYRTFNDRASCNHAVLGVKILNQENCLDGEECRAMIGAAVGMHNRFALPVHLSDDLRLITLVVRDPDKLDILGMMDEQLNGGAGQAEAMVFGLPADPALASANIIAAALDGRAASYADLKNAHDFKLLLATWIFEMNFPASRQRFAEDGHARRLLESLPPDSPYGPARAALLARFDRFCG